MSIKEIYNDALETLIIMWKRRFFVLSIILFDFLFFLGLIIINMQIFIAASDDLKNIQLMIQDQNQKLTDTEFGKIDDILMKDQEFVSRYNNVKKLLLIFVILFFGLFFILQGLAWALAHLIFHKIKIYLFAGKFFISSLLSFVLLFISGQLIINSQTLGIIVLIIIFYFITLFNSLISQQNTFKKIFELFKEQKLIISFITGFSLVLITSLDMFWLFNYNFYIGVSSSLLFFLALAFLRIHFIKSLKSLQNLQ